MASLRPIARLARLASCNLAAIWQDINLASDGLPSLAEQAIWQDDFQHASAMNEANSGPGVTIV